MLTVDYQAQLDALSYPPTHSYRVSDMTPTGALARRAHFVESCIRQCERRRAALEVGFNKGFFLYLFGRYFDRVDGCEPWREYFDLVNDMHHAHRWPGLRLLHHGGFADMPESDCYDFVFLGNCMHYVFLESNGYSFVESLARRCGDRLLIEGFTSLAGDDAYMVGARRKWPPNLQQAFTDGAFADAILPWFEEIESAPSPTGPDRRFMLFRRRKS